MTNDGEITDEEVRWLMDEAEKITSDDASGSDEVDVNVFEMHLLVRSNDGYEMPLATITGLTEHRVNTDNLTEDPAFCAAVATALEAIARELRGG